MEGKALLGEFDNEMQNTRKALEAIPADRLDFRPHERSFSLLELAGHIANLPSWTAMTLATEEFDLEAPREREEPETKEDVLAALEKSASDARVALEAASHDDLMVPWTLRSRDQEIVTMPRVAVHRSFVMNHLVHHRGQLTVYLRLMEVPVPGMYGPSADEE